MNSDKTPQEDMEEIQEIAHSYREAYEKAGKEKEYIEHILVAAGGDKAKAADALKVNLSTLYRKLSDEPKEG